jgi:NADPH:quinone reductase-like Zn-dependent oxidoreductase
METKNSTVSEKDKIKFASKLPETMKAIRLHEYGGPEKLLLETAPVPMPAPNEILIKVHAAGINPVDWKIRSGDRKDKMARSFPSILGWDVAGTVAYTGSLVAHYKEGDKVFAMLDLMRDGAYAEYVLAKVNHVAFAPAILLSAAAGVPLAAQTAWVGLFEMGNLKKKQKVLIHGGSGGVGTFALQFAKLIGAYIITTTSGANMALVKSLGADEVIDYKKQDFSEDLKDVDLVFDTIGGETQARSWKVLREDGLLVSTLAIDEKEAIKNGRVGKNFMTDSNGARLQEIAELINKRKIHVIIDKEFPLEKAKEAHEYSQSGKVSGKIVLNVL